MGCSTVPCNPSKSRGSWRQLVGQFWSFHHTCWLNEESYTVGGEFTDSDWLTGWEREGGMEIQGGRRGQQVFGHKVSDSWGDGREERWVNVAWLTDRLETVGCKRCGGGERGTEKRGWGVRGRGLKYLVTGSRVFANITGRRQGGRVGTRVGKERESV